MKLHEVEQRLKLFFQTVMICSLFIAIYQRDKRQEINEIVNNYRFSIRRSEERNGKYAHGKKLLRWRQMERLSAFDWLPRPINCVFSFLVTGVIKITCQRWSAPFERINCVILIFSIDSEIKQVLTLLFCFLVTFKFKLGQCKAIKKHLLLLLDNPHK